MNLLESYKNRLAISESVHQRSHNGAKMSAGKKLMIASVLNNTSKFMNEAFDNSAATQRSALGDFKKFCLNVSTVALPNLILPELMMTQPMTSITGYITYLRYTTGINKGGVKAGEMINSPYMLGNMTPERVEFTSDRVVETLGDDLTLMWTPVAKIVKATRDGEKVDLANVKVDAEGKVTGLQAGDKVAYIYNNEIIPQFKNNKENEGTSFNSIPTLKASMNGIALRAHARRIAVYYSQIAAFQAKTDYGYDLGENLATQAQGELAYEIDTEGVMMLINGAEKEDALTFNSYEAVHGNTAAYISRSQYYEQFSEILARAKQVLYRRTQKFAPNYMICGSNILTILPYLKGWTAASVSTINGPYFAGTVDGLKVFVSPAIGVNEYVFGVNGTDLQTSAAVYAPYMAIVPTQLLGFADGTMSQGFSTMYDMKLLSTYNVVDGKRVDVVLNGGDPDTGDLPEIGQYSWLLVKGEMNTVPPAEDAVAPVEPDDTTDSE